MATPNVTKALAILALGTLVVGCLLHVARVDAVRAGVGMILFILLGATALLKEAKS